MKRATITVLVLGSLLLFGSPGWAAGLCPPVQVVANGGGCLTGWDTVLFCTVGQPCIGSMSSSSHEHGVGFWYQEDITTPVPPGSLPIRYELGQNRPNPFNPVTTLAFSVPKRSHVTLKLYDISGREVRTIVNEELNPGYYTRVLDAAGLASGVYLCRMMARDFVETRKLVLLK